jgi:Domain of unknown function (DUF4158)
MSTAGRSGRRTGTGTWPARPRPREFLDGRAWTHAEGPYRLFGQAVGWLRRNRVLLPGVSVLARLVASVRDGAAERMYRSLAEAATAADVGLPSRLRGLLVVPDGQRASELERLRAAPRRTSGKAMTMALDRVSEVLALGARSAGVEAVPANRLAALARYGLAAKAPALRDLAEPRRTATLLATARHLEAAAVDDALDLFDVLMATRLISTARRASAAERLAAMPRLERASVTLASAARALLAALDDGGAWLDTGAAWAAVERVAPREDVFGAVAVVEELVPDDASEDAAMCEALTARYGVVRPFLELLAEALPLGAAPAGEKLLAEVRRLPELARRRVRARHLGHDEVTASLGPRRMAACGLPESGLAGGRGRPGRLRAVHPGAAAPGAAPPRHLRQPLGAVVRSARPAARRRRLARRPRRSPGRPRPDRDGQPAPGRSHPRARRRVAAARRPDGRGRGRRPCPPGTRGRRADPAGRRPARGDRRTRIARQAP